MDLMNYLHEFGKELSGAIIYQNPKLRAEVLGKIAERLQEVLQMIREELDGGNHAGETSE
jgi:hypothetical protein